MDEEYEHYTDSGGKSGGQKEKLAYTILGASLAYNYGINEKEKSSFCLIIIDEAFLKSSDESATFGLELFKKLNDAEKEYYKAEIKTRILKKEIDK